MITDKIKTREEITKIAVELRKNNPNIKIVTSNGAFDIMHSGHVKSLEKAKSYGDVLIIGINSDSSVKRYKSPLRPIIPEKERAFMMAAISVVDYVCIFDEDDPRELLRVIKPDIHVKSKSGYTGLEKETVEKNGGKIIVVDDVIGISTTKIIERIKEIEVLEKNLKK